MRPKLILTGIATDLTEAYPRCFHAYRSALTFQSVSSSADVHFISVRHRTPFPLAQTFQLSFRPRFFLTASSNLVVSFPVFIVCFCFAPVTPAVPV